MKYLSKEQIIFLHEELIRTSGGLQGILDEGLLDSAIYAPLQTYSGEELYPSLIEKASRLAYGLINNHPFIDGNKRIGTHAMLILLCLNGVELTYEDDELVDIIMEVAAGKAKDEKLYDWIIEHITNQ